MWEGNPMPLCAHYFNPFDPSQQSSSFWCVYYLANVGLIARPVFIPLYTSGIIYRDYVLASYDLHYIDDTSPLFDPVTQHRWSYRWWRARTSPGEPWQWIDGPVETVFDGSGRDQANPNPAGYRTPADGLFTGAPVLSTPLEYLPIYDPWNRDREEPPEPPPSWDGPWPLGNFPKWFEVTDQMPEL